MEEKILKVKDLVVDFPIFGGIMQRQVDSVHAVKKVSFDLIKGETLGIVGAVSYTHLTLPTIYSV